MIHPFMWHLVKTKTVDVFFSFWQLCIIFNWSVLKGAFHKKNFKTWRECTEILLCTADYYSSMSWSRNSICYLTSFPVNHWKHDLYLKSLPMWYKFKFKLMFYDLFLWISVFNFVKKSSVVPTTFFFLPKSKNSPKITSSKAH